MTQQSYIEYLETLALSLLVERGDKHDDIKIADPAAGPSLKGFTVSAYNAAQQIQQMRDVRKLQRVIAESERISV
jgi:hypothetical protein